MKNFLSIIDNPMVYRFVPRIRIISIISAIVYAIFLGSVAVMVYLVTDMFSYRDTVALKDILIPCYPGAIGVGAIYVFELIQD